MMPEKPQLTTEYVIGGADLPPRIQKVFERLILACQANFDHLSGEAQNNAKVFNRFVEFTETELEEWRLNIQAQIDDLP